MAVDIGPIIDYVSRGGLVGLLVVILVGGAKQWWVFGWQFQMMQNDRDQWRAIAMSGTDIAQRAVDRLPKS